MSYLQITNLELAYGSHTVLHDCSLDLERGQILSLLGASGSGKSTLLKALAGLIPLQKGSISLQGRCLNQLPPQERQVGMIFQDYALFPHLNVNQNIRFGLNHLSASQQAERVAEVLHLVRLEHLAQRLPHQLSGGQQQRIALARALAREPALLLLDEAFSNLDEQVRQHLLDEIRPLLKTRGITAIAVTHHHHEAYSLADRIAVLHQGCLLACDTPEALYRHTHPDVAPLLGSCVMLTAPHPLLPPATQGTVALRPQDFICQRHHQGQARVEEALFLGESYAYRLRFQDGSTLKITLNDVFQAGEALQVSLKPDALSE